MLDRENNRIYIKYRKNGLAKNIVSIISFGIFWLAMIDNYSKVQYKSEMLNIFFQSHFASIFFAMVFFILFIIYALSMLFSSDINYHIDLSKKMLVLIQGKKPFRTEINVDFGQIKAVVVTKGGHTGEAKFYRKYSIDIYDKNLNAYECYDEMDYQTIKDIAGELGNTLNVSIVDRTDIENYEGFIQRVI
ncbi:MAG: hypothetical protein LBJ41_04170 [Treponema sp.]|jgi:hypothetical protein|nr:hypothetical protein [Treponema sp.]